MASPATSATTAKKSPVGYQCTITGKDGLLGTIRFYGKTKFKEGVWAGLELTTPGTLIFFKKQFHWIGS